MSVRAAIEFSSGMPVPSFTERVFADAASAWRALADFRADQELDVSMAPQPSRTVRSMAGRVKAGTVKVPLPGSGRAYRYVVAQA
ncbi:hypothetical protein ACFWGN_21010 [Oerskovia sp. NPDC060338]|uniref:hypothetical protein n=1 Tax=Oerskovia sp. NPDC060338 TaxID=3347100 RepID=UPI0036668A61